MNQLRRVYTWFVARPFVLLVAVTALFIFINQKPKTETESAPIVSQSEASFAAVGGGGSVSRKDSAAFLRKGFGGGESVAMDDAGSATATTSLTDLLTPSAHAQQNTMLIRNGHISAYVDSLTKIKQKVGELLKTQVAHIENENQSDEYNSTVLRLTIKVPAEKFQPLFDQLLKLSEKIRSHSVNVDDVMKQYTDVKSRLENKKELQNRLRALLQKASKVSDILEIERELARVSEDIDSSTKIMKQFENDARLSTINLDFSEPKSQIEGPAPLNFFKKLGLAVLSGWHMIIDTVLEIVMWWPLWLLIAAGYVWYRRKKR